jgi:ribosomal protein L7/L12
MPETALLVLLFAGLLCTFPIYFLLSMRLATIDRKVTRIAHRLGIDPLAAIPLSERVKEIARDPSRKIEAIKVYREESGAGLAEAKDAIEEYQNGLRR